jgi:hypothetical protein
MAISINTHIPAASSSTEVQLPVTDWTLFRTDVDKPHQTDLIRVSTGKSYRNMVRFESTTIQDVYNNTPLQSSSLKNGTRSGTKCYLHEDQVWSKVNSEDPTYEVLVPFAFECNCRSLDDPLITTELLLAQCDESYAKFRQQLESLRLGANNPKVN